mgnify:FL=1
MKLSSKPAAILLGLALAFSASAQAALEGVDYEVLKKPIPQQDASKIEVLEFFDYSCIHCQNFDPVLLSYSKTFPKDVYLRSEHVVWMPEMLGLARVAAAVNALGLKYQANPAIYNAIHEQKINLADTATFKSWAAAQKSFDSKKLIAAYDAPASLAAAKKMQRLTETYRIDGTPDVIVGGKYRVIFHTDWEQAQKIIGELVDQVRQERSGKAASKAAR